jgi:hypothetical protein
MNEPLPTPNSKPNFTVEMLKALDDEYQMGYLTGYQRAERTRPIRIGIPLLIALWVGFTLGMLTTRLLLSL